MGLFKQKVTIEKLATNSIGEEIGSVCEGQEWIWVEGYKGTDSNMMCKSQQYELNTKYVIDGEPIKCSNGYHFCKYINNVFDYYKYDFHNRYFKVKALVKKSDWDGRDDKYVAAAIIFTEELFYTYEELVSFGALSVWHSNNGWRRTVMPKSLFEAYKINPNMLTFQWYINEMTQAGHSEAFASILVSEYENWYWYTRIIEYVHALAEEGLSKDMRAYLLHEKVKEMKT